MRFKYLLLFVSLLMAMTNVYSQKMKFTADTSYIREMGVLVSKVTKPEVDTIYNRFAREWDSGDLTIRQKANIISVSNELLRKRARVQPHFTNYMQFIMSVLNSDKQVSKFDNWHLVIEELSKRGDFNSNRLNKLLEKLILLNDSNFFFQSRAAIWKTNDDNFRVEYDGKTDLRIQFNQLDLICLSKRDSSIIYKTKGYFDPISNIWVGTGGVINWQRAGFSKDSVYANLLNYRIDLRKPEFKADSVEFTNKRYLKQKLVGWLEEKVIANATGAKASYPRFVSYDKRIELKKVVPSVDYSGGFAQRGSKFFGYGDAEQKAQLFLYKEDNLFATANSTVFVFSKSNIRGDNVSIEVKIANDTLMHPGLNFNYFINDKKLSLIRNGGALSHSRFYDSYHNLEIDVSEMSFNLEDSVILFKSPPATTYRKAVFTSSNYFSVDEYNFIQLNDRKHPLEAIRRISPNVGEEFEAKELAHYLRKAESSCVTLLLRLSDEGFIHYDPDTRIAYPKQKLFDYIRANYKKKDYDEIRIVSEPAFGNNAVLNLKNNNLEINGTKPFALSNNRRVGIIPNKGKVTIRKDLEIIFDGKLQAGLANVYGKDLNFEYDSFYVHLQKADSVRLHYRSVEKNEDSVFVYSQVTSTIDSVNGLLRIDEPLNKSGLKTYDIYPVFESHEASYVFYDIMLNGDTVYRKEQFYFVNEPFEIDSLNTITRNNVRMDGTFISGGVFPDLEETLIVQPDSSLGFTHKLDSVGKPVYNGLGLYHNAITLNNSGLKGDGKLTYLNTDLYSEQFDFYPDSMNTFTTRAEMKKLSGDTSKTRYPEMHADSSYVHWEPLRDQMYISSLKEPLDMYNENAKLEGTLELKPEKLGGVGTFTFLDANLHSETYTFYDESFIADTADFKLVPEEGEESRFLTYNVSADVDFTKKHGMFNSNGDNSYIEFPVNQYKCYMNFFSWKMGINEIDIGTVEGEDKTTADIVAETDSTKSELLSDAGLYTTDINDTIYTAQDLAMRSKFISTNPAQDSLSYYAVSSKYDITNNIIKAKGVKFINVADARVFPASELIIQSGADMKPFSGAKIVANREQQYHVFFDAEVKINGAKDYTGSGDYEYIDKLDSMQIIHFADIRVNKDLITRATGNISERDYFALAPEFPYYGQASIKAVQKHIDFKGFVSLNHDCKNRMDSYWMQFKSTINPDSIYIPIAEQPRDHEGNRLYKGVYATKDSLGIYTSFLDLRRRATDKPIIETEGYLFYNDTTGYFEIADSAKFADRETDGNYLSFHKKLCLVLSHGNMEMGVDLGQVKLSPVGKFRQNLDSWKSHMDVMMGIDFFFSEPALNEMAAKLNEGFSLDPVDLGSDDYQLALRELTGHKRAKKYIKEFGMVGGYNNLPVEMNKSLFLSAVSFNWNHKHSAWVSEGKIGIGNVKNTQVNKYVDGFIEIKKTRGGDIINIYLEINPKNWFFFTYTRGTLKSVSSSDVYNNYIIDLKDKERKSPDKLALTPYMFFPATERAKDNFVNQMKNRLAKGDEDFNLDVDKVLTSNKNNKSGDTEVELEKEEDFMQEGEINEKEVLIELEDVGGNTEKINLTEEEINKESTSEKEEEGLIEETPKKEEIKTEEIKKEVKAEEVKKDEKKKEVVKKEENNTIEKKEEEEEEEFIEEEEEEEEEEE